MQRTSAVPGLKKLKDQVEHCLKTARETRDSDKTLAIAVWGTFYSHLVHEHLVPLRGPTLAITLDNLYELPSYDSISRMRRVFQQKKLYPPSDLRTAISRGWLEGDWRRALGYKVEEPGQLKFDL